MISFSSTKLRNYAAALGVWSAAASSAVWLVVAVALGAVCLPGCMKQPGNNSRVELMYGKPGGRPGEFQKPRAVVASAKDEIYAVDMTGRIQVFTRDGEYVRGWRTPEVYVGKPSGLSVDRDGNIMVADTHYFRVLFYTPQGKLLEEKTIGGTMGHGPGEFGFVTDAVQDSAGNYYVGEYGEYDRIQKFDREGKFLFQWGGHGEEPGQFIRPQNLAIDSQDRIWVADACNHRIQVFDATGDSARLVDYWGVQGEAPGEMRYPYDLELEESAAGDINVYVCEFGNHRIQKFDSKGKPLGLWGVSGRRAGQLHQPWAIARDSHGSIHVLDTYNHRIQRIGF